MSSPLSIRAMAASDLQLADSLRALAGWNQTMADWRRFLEMQPSGCFLAEWDGAPAGTATTVVYGPELAWIGMVLVLPGFRRRGIGRGLLLKCIAHLQAAGVRCMKLDATPGGHAVYEQLGFKDEWTLRRWEAGCLAPAAQALDSDIRPWKPADALRLDSLDTRAFGACRRDLTLALSLQSRFGLTYEIRAGIPAGFGLLRHGSQASYLGPVSATSAEAGLALIEALIAQAGPGRVFWDIPDPNSAAIDWAAGRGFTVQRSLTRMYLGENRNAGDPLQQFAIAGPELG